MTAREYHVLVPLAAGHSTVVIASRLDVISKTVSNNVSYILVKLYVAGQPKPRSWRSKSGASRPQRGRELIDSQRVTTTRVVLRAFASKDLPRIELLFSEPDVAQWNPGPVVRNREVWCAESNAGQGGNEFRIWAVVDPDDDRLLGTVSVFDAHDGKGKIGYRVLTGESGRGVATEAVRAATRRGADELGLHAIWLTHAVNNDASCRVATKAGYHAQATVAGTEVYGDGLMHDEHLHRHDI